MHPPTTEERLEFVTRFLQRRRAYLACAVLRLGKVQFTDAVETAAICVAEEVVTLYFNPCFFQAIDNLELAGVLAHESLHFALRHQLRFQAIRRQGERFLFNLATDAVINDLIAACYPELKLPGKPVTGLGLIGQDASQMSAEQVFQRLRGMQRASGQNGERVWSALRTVDDHSLWHPDERPAEEMGKPGPVWSEASSGLASRLFEEWSRKDAAYGTMALGAERLVPPAKHRMNLAKFLIDSLRFQRRWQTRWIPPNRKLSAFYPVVILPSYELTSHWDVLMAIDTSGSVPDEFLSVALALARQDIPHTRITLVSFDTRIYPTGPAQWQLRGGGGTRVQAVEEFAQTQLPRYPDQVFVMTDGFTPPPTLLHPQRWLWLLPAWGSTEAIPKGCRAEFFQSGP